MVRASSIAAGTLLCLGIFGAGSVVVRGVLWTGAEGVTVPGATTLGTPTPAAEVAAAPAPAPTPPSPESPARLRIDSLGIDASVQHQGINAAGRMATPSNFSDVAWYKLGPLPGRLGNAVIAAHVDNGLGLPAVFKRLGEIQEGSVIEIETHAGAVQRFKVTGMESLPYEESAQKIFVGTGAARLVLVTCEGAWLKDEQTYDKRLLVYAEPLP